MMGRTDRASAAMALLLASIWTGVPQSASAIIPTLETVILTQEGSGNVSEYWRYMGDAGGSVEKILLIDCEQSKIEGFAVGQQAKFDPTGPYVRLNFPEPRDILLQALSRRSERDGVLTSEGLHAVHSAMRAKLGTESVGPQDPSELTRVCEQFGWYKTRWSKQ